VNSGAVQSNALRFVTLAGHTTVGGTGRWDIRADPTAELSTGGNSYNLTKVGANQVSVVGAAVDAALGDINVAAGILSMELAAGAGDPSKTLTVANGATIQFVGRTVPWSKNAVLNGGRNVLNANGDTTMNGTVALTAPVTFENAGTTLTVNGPISGPGSLTKTGANPLALGSDNSYTGGTVISAGVLQLGIGGNSGSVLGSVANNGTLSIYRGDAYTLTNPITGTGAIFVRTTNGLTLSSTPLNPSTLSVGNLSQGLLIVPAGITVNAPNFNLGDSSTISGDGLQTGGDITVSALMRVGHWPSPFVSTYVMGGGTLTLTATPAGVVNQAGVAEQNGIIYLGIDGTGVFMQTGGVARAHGIVLDARGNTAGTDIFTLNGGRFTVGPSGIKSGSLDANLTYAINLGGGTLASSGNWTSVLNMSITGTNGDVKVDSSGFDVTLNGVLSGPGGLVKQGAGALRLNGANNFAGTLLVGAGTLTGNGAIGGPVVIQAGATLAPGVGLGTLTVNNTLQLGGTTVMEINKAGTVLSGDRIAGNGAITYGGTLTVVASGAALVHGDAFNLFDGSSLTGSFTTINLPTLGANLAWDLSKLASEGIIRVTGPELAIGINAGNISLAWPDAFANFLLQAQTNAPGLGITGDWVTVLGLTTNRFTFPVVTDPAVGSIFYRLQAP
jgi:autotransporter-associated beta strand protein